MGNALCCLRVARVAGEEEQSRRSLTPRKRMTCNCCKKIRGRWFHSRVAAEESSDFNVDRREENTQQETTEDHLQKHKKTVGDLLKWLAVEGHYGVHITEDEFYALGDGFQMEEEDDAMGSFAEMGERLNDHQQGLKEHRQKLSQKEQELVLAIEAAQTFLEQNVQDPLRDEEVALQENLNVLMEEYESALSSADSQLNVIEDLHLELQKFRKDNDEFETLMIHSEKELQKIKAEEFDSTSLTFKLKKQKFLFNDLQFLKGDLRYLRRSWKSLFDAAFLFEIRNAIESYKIPIDPDAISQRVEETVESADARFNALRSECIGLGIRLSTKVFEQWQEKADELRLWLERVERERRMVQLEAIPNPEILQQELENIMVLQGEISEHEDGVEKLQEAAKCLLNLSNDVVPNIVQLRKTTATIEQRFQRLRQETSEQKRTLERTNVQVEDLEDS
ncbi:microtubule-actin cross-linking factor 1-like isoform X1 [Narcine bancroftii]|uniref:microtubule-actin cross-linking factor 1-like isoform X1 n=3 Tax=Narcine bancroftii TaxID=1343680 RepID=UPI0038320DB6